MYTQPWTQHYPTKPVAKIGTWIQGNEWPKHDWHKVIAGDEMDVKYFDTDLRHEIDADPQAPINSLPLKVELTGEMVYTHDGVRWMTCRITTWGSNEEEVSFPGKLILEVWNNRYYDHERQAYVGGEWVGARC